MCLSKYVVVCEWSIVGGIKKLDEDSIEENDIFIKSRGMPSDQVKPH